MARKIQPKKTAKIKKAKKATTSRKTGAISIFSKKFEPEILYQSSDYVVINKKPGILVHSDGLDGELRSATKTKTKTRIAAVKGRRYTTFTLADWIIKKFPKIKEVGEPGISSTGKSIWRPGIVHRLDRDTSGVMILAKNQQAYLKMKKQFQDRTTIKSYRAFLYGAMSEKEGIVDMPIGRSKNDFRKWTSERGMKGEIREARTAFRVHKVVGKGHDGFTYIEARPMTGRTHQIRVHFKAKGFPVVADGLYAGNKIATTAVAGSKQVHNKQHNSLGLPADLGFKRLALHAYSITFHETDGKRVEVVAPLPKDFVNAKKALEGFI